MSCDPAIQDELPPGFHFAEHLLLASNPQDPSSPGTQPGLSGDPTTPAMASAGLVGPAKPKQQALLASQTCCTSSLQHTKLHLLSKLCFLHAVNVPFQHVPALPPHHLPHPGALPLSSRKQFLPKHLGEERKSDGEGVRAGEGAIKPGRSFLPT